jgi:ATP-binding cassette subfamily F protein uup
VAEQEQATQAPPSRTARQSSSAGSAPPANSARKKLSYLEAREYASIEQRVEASDQRLAAALARVEDPEIAIDAAALQQALAEFDAAKLENNSLYARWAELTEKAGESASGA